MTFVLILLAALLTPCAGGFVFRHYISSFCGRCGVHEKYHQADHLFRFRWISPNRVCPACRVDPCRCEIVRFRGMRRFERSISS